MSTVLGIVSGKGGTGKSTVACGLGICFSDMLKRVLLVDLDEGLRSLDLLMGVDGSVTYDLSDVLEGRDITEAIYPSPVYPNVKVIPAPLKTGMLNLFNFKGFLAAAERLFDVIILDFPAGTDFTLLRQIENIQVLTVSNMDPVSVRDAYYTAEELCGLKTAPRLIINKFNALYIKDGVYKNIDEIINDSSLQLLGLVPSSPELALFSVNHGISPKGNGYKSFMRIARRISGEDVKLPKINKI